MAGDLALSLSPPPALGRRLLPKLSSSQMPTSSSRIIVSGCASGSHWPRGTVTVHRMRGRVHICVPKAAEQQGQVSEEEVVDSKILPYCSIDKKAEKKSLGELEQDFLQALQSFYYDGTAIMSNEEFDNLKEELMWEGSSVVMLSLDEQKCLEASMAYVSGKPIMTDAEYDELKLELKVKLSLMPKFEILDSSQVFQVNFLYYCKREGSSMYKAVRDAVCGAERYISYIHVIHQLIFFSSLYEISQQVFNSLQIALPYVSELPVHGLI